MAELIKSGSAGLLSVILYCSTTWLGPVALAQSSQQLKSDKTNLATVDQVLSRKHVCSPTLQLRSQAMSAAQQTQACTMLGQLEQKFHAVFATQGKPVAHDHNTNLRANIYASKDDYLKYAGLHFNMPTDNGGMYLEGLPDQPGNQAEFVANQKTDGSVHNLGHEYIHYLDGRYNLYGDFCANLHDSHAPPENCAKPAPGRPYLVWWTEGVAEYIAHGEQNPRALGAAKQASYKLSQLFDTGYESENGTERIYSWGYLAVRYMMERQRSKVDTMLGFTRVGDYPRYQALVRSWGTSMDEDFRLWLTQLAAPAP